MWPLADALAERVIATLCIGCDGFTVEDAAEALYHHMLKTTHVSDPDDTEDERRGNEMSADGDSNLMIGFALGRRIGGAR